MIAKVQFLLLHGAQDKANEIVKIGETSKQERNGRFVYYFNTTIVECNPADNTYKHVTPNRGFYGSIAFADITDKLGASNIEEYLDQVALQGLMGIVGTGGGGGAGGELVSGATPPADTAKKWFNTGDNLIYYYDGSDWLSEQLFSVEFNDQGTTPNNTFFRIGNTATTDNGVGYNIPFPVSYTHLTLPTTPYV